MTTGKDKGTDDSTPNSGKSKDGPSPGSESPGAGTNVFAKKKKDDTLSPAVSDDEHAAPSGAASGRGSGSGSGPRTGGTLSASNVSNLTMLTEDQVGKDKTPGKDKDKEGKSSPASSAGKESKDVKPLRGRKRKAEGKPKAARRPPAERQVKKPKPTKPKFNKNFKIIRKAQEKHKRSFYPFIMKILRDTQPGKRINPQAMMICDSFANDLSDKIIGAATQLVAKSGKKTLTAGDIIASFKLVLPADMARDAQKCMESSIQSYRENTAKHQEGIRATDKLKNKIIKKDGEGGSTPTSPASPK